MRLNPLLLDGAGGRNRTDMELPPRDFESRASTSFTTPANFYFLPQQLFRCQPVIFSYRGFPHASNRTIHLEGVHDSSGGFRYIFCSFTK